MPTPERMQRYRDVAARRQQGVVVLEDIHDPHNAEAVFRSCDAFGFQRVCLIFDEEEPFDPRRVGKLSSSSANKWLDFEVYSSARECLDALHEEGFEVVATVAEGETEELYGAELTAPRIAVMLGNENRGLSPEAVALADRRLTIPMAGMVRSLNLSVTAAIVLFELTRQRGQAGVEQYLLPADEREALAKALGKR
ncbi:MAG: RNA methyltransferase [Dehalococcoidia bacterium]|nr:RNA methyltransferase [Dehalococcoidia bacterium]